MNMLFLLFLFTGDKMMLVLRAEIKPKKKAKMATVSTA
jgi:hypothetical protein